MSNDKFLLNVTSYFGRGNNALSLYPDGRVIIFTNINEGTSKLDMQIAEISGVSEMFRLYSSKAKTNIDYSVPFGERISEVLEWLIQIMMTHSHPPNAAAIPDFHQKAQAYLNNLRNGWANNPNFRHK
ncbi:MAG: hypothetical protein ACFFG0_18970 [Candidatus Thorarchaeota archaeon]